MSPRCCCGFTPPTLTPTLTASCGSTCSRGRGGGWASTRTPSPGSPAPWSSPAQRGEYRLWEQLAVSVCSHLTLEALRVEISVQSSDPGSFGLTFLWHDGFAAHGALGREHPGHRMLATSAFPVPLLQSYCYGFHLLHFKNLIIAIQEFN